MNDHTLAPAARTDVPARLDRLPWSRFHRLVVIALGITWILDGLEVTLAGSVAAALQTSPALQLTPEQIGLTGSAYLAGAVLGSLFFGHLTDRLGRKKLFNVTLGVYLVATALTAFSWDFWSFALFRFLTGAGIGGEYSAINSAIQELIPARLRGRTDLAINGSFWVGAARRRARRSVVAARSRSPCRPTGLAPRLRLGAVLGLVILFLRRFLPESPRWLMLHGQPGRGRARGRRDRGARRRPANVHAAARDADAGAGRHAPRHAGLGGAHAAARTIRGAPCSALVLMAAQAFIYNAIFFTYALILTTLLRRRGRRVGLYILPFAVGNFLGPLLLGPLFDTLGRKPMIAATYGCGRAARGHRPALRHGPARRHDADGDVEVVFFFASAAASAAYLTVGECFPLEMRALTIALFYAFGTLLGGVGGPWLFGVLIASGSPQGILWAICWARR